MVHCGSAFGLGASRLPYYCAPLVQRLAGVSGVAVTNKQINKRSAWQRSWCTVRVNTVVVIIHKTQTYLISKSAILTQTWKPIFLSSVQIVWVLPTRFTVLSLDWEQIEWCKRPDLTNSQICIFDTQLTIFCFVCLRVEFLLKTDSG